MQAWVLEKELIQLHTTLGYPESLAETNFNQRPIATPCRVIAFYFNYLSYILGKKPLRIQGKMCILFILIVLL